MAADGHPLILLAAGGTGGHLFPAEALAAALARRGVTIDLVTDERATRFGHAFPARTTHTVRSATVRGRNPVALARTGLSLGLGLFDSFAILRGARPAAVVGFGGYPTIPPVIAATLRRIPTIIHDQNAVMGRANRFLAPRVTAIATSFTGALDRTPALAAKATRTGNPVRAAVIVAADIPFDVPTASGALRVLVFGGSQGARVMADVVPPAVGKLAPSIRDRLVVTQQARDEDEGRVRDAYAALGVNAEVAPFFGDLPARIARSHLVVSRAGASTVAELATIGRPAILVPLPHALDQDQRANAGVLAAVKGAIRMSQEHFTPDRLAHEITTIAAAPEQLAAMAAAAKSAGAIDAAERLADLVLGVAGLNQGRHA